MTVAARVGGYVLLLVVVGLLATALGRAVGPIGAAASDEMTAGMEMPAEHGSQRVPDTVVGALMGSQSGYTLQPGASILAADADATVEFRVSGPDGRPVEAHTPSHEKYLHPIALRRDLASYRHVHPVRDGEGVWRAPLDLSQAGDYRPFFDFRHEGVVRTAAFTVATDGRAAGVRAAGAQDTRSRNAAPGGSGHGSDGHGHRGERP